MALKFLVVDDDDLLASLTAQVIQKSFPGSDVRAAHTNDHAFEILTSFIPHLVATDINHPGESGFELPTRLRSDPKTAFIPVVAVSGSSTDQQQLAQYKHGFDAVVPKPWQTERLITTIARLLRVRADPDLLLIHLGFETQSHDYKETVELVSKFGRASLAKDVMAMANWGGGTIVVGMTSFASEDRKSTRLNSSHTVISY